MDVQLAKSEQNRVRRHRDIKEKQQRGKEKTMTDIRETSERQQRQAFTSNGPCMMSDTE